MTGLVRFPLRNDKSPAVGKGVSWKTYTGRHDTPVYGIAVPSGVFIIDLDLYKGVTQESVNAALGCAPDWDAAALQKTLNGGVHYAFAVSVKLSQGQDIGGMVGFDTRAAGDGYIATGAGYTDLTALGLEWVLVNPSYLPQLPAAALDYFSQHHSKPKQLAPVLPGIPDFGAFLDARPVGVDLNGIELLLAKLPDTAADDGDTWLRVGMAIWHETHGSEDGWTVFDEFSQRAMRGYDERENRNRWDSFGNTGQKNPVTLASVIKMVNDANPKLILPTVDEVSEDAYELARSIEFQLFKLLEGVELPSGAITHASVFEVCPQRLHMIITGCYWQPTGAKGVWLLNHNEYLNFHAQATAHEFIGKKFGKVYNADVLTLAARIKHGLDPSLASTVERYVQQITALPLAAVMRHLEFNNQRTAVAFSVDMFAERSTMELEENSVRIVYEHRELTPKVRTVYRPEVIDDYLQHFPRYHRFLEFILAARFAPDRKKAYLWIHAGSDWGKGFLMGVFNENNLACSVELNMNEIEKMFEGSPVGRAPSDFKRAMILNFNEVRYIRSELKEVESSLRLSPKHQMTSTVDVYAKLLWSADDIGSLVGEAGVEDQLSNRISVFKESTDASINNRPLYRTLGNLVYHNCIVQYTAGYMNKRIAEYRALGLEESSRVSQQYLDEFHAENSIGKMYGVVSEALPEMADSLLADIMTTPFEDYRELGVIRNSTDFFLTKPKKFVESWIRGRYTRSELPVHLTKINQLLALISLDGTGKTSVVRNEGSTARVLKLRK